MNPLDRFRHWIAKPLLDRLREELDARNVLTIAAFQQEAYKVGRAHGELIGAQNLLAEFGRIMDERHAQNPELQPGDLERAKKGILH